jgi:hypothetical protein
VDRTSRQKQGIEYSKPAIQQTNIVQGEILSGDAYLKKNQIND